MWKVPESNILILYGVALTLRSSAHSAVNLLRNGHCSLILASFFSLFFIMSVAAGYEVIEWWYAVAEGGDAGIEFLGSQGDVWDAQKDMLADTLGAITALTLYWLTKPHLKHID